MVGVGVPTRTGGISSYMDTGDTSRVMSGSGATVEVRLMGPAATMDIATGMVVHVGANVIHTTPSTPREDRDRSTVSRPTVMEVAWDK